MAVTTCGHFATTLAMYDESCSERKQTFEVLCEKLVAAAQKRNPTSGSSRYAAAAVTNSKAPQGFSRAEAMDMLKDVLREYGLGGTAVAPPPPAANLNQPLTRGDMPALIAAAVKVLKDSDATEYPFFCWTHGPNPTHPSSQCKNPAHGHCKEATFKNQINGRPTPFKQRHRHSGKRSGGGGNK